VHLFAQGKVQLKLDGGDVTLRQVTNYPWDGNVKFEIGLSAPQKFSLHLRLPGWCQQWSIQINGTPVTGLQPADNGYLAVEREWQPGDVVMYQMDMPIQAVFANPAVRYLEGRIAIQRGPLVYCLEGTDHNHIILDRIAIDAKQISSGNFAVEHQDILLGGVSILHGRGIMVEDGDWDGKLYRREQPVTKPVEITAVPYYAWDNRAPGEMRVWLRSLA
jgi:uncharacterized protein